MATVRCLYAGRRGVFLDERGERHQVFTAFEASASWFAQQSAMYPRLITVETWCERVARMPRSALIQHHVNRQLPHQPDEPDWVLRHRLTAELGVEPLLPSVEEARAWEAHRAPAPATPPTLPSPAPEVVSDVDTEDAPASSPQPGEDPPEVVSDVDTQGEAEGINPVVRAQVAELMAAVEAESYPDVFRSIKVVRDALMPEAGIPKPKPELFDLARELGRRAEEMG